jgi:alcohol dehydrogenase
MDKMHAMVIPSAGGRFEFVERDLPTPGASEALIAIEACGVCHSDALIVEGGLPGLTYPRVPGHEVIGRIQELGVEVEGWRIGERVGIGWHSGGCGHCTHCRHGDAFACENVQGATGLTRDGGYATHMVARSSALARVPEALDAVEAAPLLCAGLTTFNALRNCGAGPGDLVAIHGLGGLGHLGIQYAARLGYTTVAISRGSAKEKLARSLGADVYIDGEANDAAAELRALGGAKAIIATVADGEAMEAIVGGLGPNGTLMAIGLVAPIRIDVVDLLMKRASIKGWYSGTAVDAEDALDFSLANQVESMNEVFPLRDAQAAYDRLMSGQARFRVVLQV